jgi:hypothetical protein
MRFNRAGLIVLFLALGCGRRASTGAMAAKNPSLLTESRRVVVEVLNPGKQVGVARTATVRLRQQGLDVVYFGNLADTALARRERSLIYVRRGDTTGVGRVIAAIGDAEVVDRADATRLVDLSVVLGRQLKVRGDPR